MEHEVERNLEDHNTSIWHPLNTYVEPTVAQILKLLIGNFGNCHFKTIKSCKIGESL